MMERSDQNDHRRQLLDRLKKNKNVVKRPILPLRLQTGHVHTCALGLCSRAWFPVRQLCWKLHDQLSPHSITSGLIYLIILLIGLFSASIPPHLLI